MGKVFGLFKKVYTNIPLDEELKIKLKGKFYTTFGNLLKNNESYKQWLEYQQWLEMLAKRPKQGILKMEEKELDKFRFLGKIAIQLHLFYVDLMDEFVEYFSNMPYQFDLYISIVDEKVREEVRKKAACIPTVNKIVIKKVENRGRDVAPLIAVFAEALLKYDYFCHVHSKKSLFTGNEQMDWRRHLLNYLFGSEDLIKRIFYGFEHGDKVGMVYPETFAAMPYWGHTWLQSEKSRDELFAKLGMSYIAEKKYIEFPMGTMFWARTKALRQFLQAGITVEDFPIEEGQTDGTIAHAFERCTVPVCRRNGYNVLIYDDRFKEFTYNTGRKNFEQYYAKSFEQIREEAQKYDIVSFDIFDTLVSRVVARPDDAFDLLEHRLKEGLFPQLDFKKLRKEAEATCRRKNPAQNCDLDDIYREFAAISGLSEEACETIKKAELENELELVFPKEEMLELYHDITETLGKRIFIVSDMYLRRGDIERILKKCGITHYEKLLISSEMNLRKDDGTFWKEYSAKYQGQTWMHIGDNEKSDMQIAGDYGIRGYHILSSGDLYECSNMGTVYPLSQIDNVTTSVAVGLTLRKLLDNPFAINKNMLAVRIKREEDFGYAVIGPVLLGYMNNLCRNIISQKASQVFFFAREGYLLKELFDIIKEKVAVLSDAEGRYIQVSRRALSVASLKNKQDIEELLDITYSGSFHGLLHTRFGITDATASAEYVKLPEEVEKVSVMLEPYQDEILQRAEEECRSYLNYYRSLQNKKEGRIMVSDIGYSGSIQYYLSKLTGDTFDGYYFVTDSKKRPLALDGNTMHGYYIENDSHQECSSSYVHRYHLLLESILISPKGQFVRVNNDGTFQYTEQDNSYFTEQVKKCHNGIKKYFEDFYGTLKTAALKNDIDRSYPEKLIKIIIEGNIIDETFAKSFVVEDFYCSNMELSVFEHYHNCLSVCNV